MRFQRTVIILLSAIVLLLAVPRLPAVHAAIAAGFDDFVGWDSSAKAAYARDVAVNQELLRLSHEHDALLSARAVRENRAAVAPVAYHQPNAEACRGWIRSHNRNVSWFLDKPRFASGEVALVWRQAEPAPQAPRAFVNTAADLASAKAQAGRLLLTVCHYANNGSVTSADTEDETDRGALAQASH